MKILLVVQDWISFYNQAEAMSVGLRELGVDHKLIRMAEVEGSSRIYRVYKPDVVVGVGSWHSFEAFVKKPKSLGCKVLPWIVSDDLVERYVDGYNELNLIATPSNYCENVFVRDGIRAEILRILPEAVDPERWYQQNKEETEEFLRYISIESSFPIPWKYDLSGLKKEGVPFILTMGGDATSKGAQEVIKALAKLDRKIQWIYLIKTWPQEHTFRRGLEEYELIKRYNLEERIRYMVADFSQEFIQSLISICDIYVAPSRGEGFGLPFVQAQMCGKPIVSINAHSIQEVVVSGETGYLVKSVRDNGILKADIDDLAKYLKLMLTDDKLRGKMGQAAKNHAIKNYHPKVIANKLLTLINSI